MSMRHALRFILALAFLSAAPAAHAQLFRAYLASDGLDSNACTLGAPCRLLPAALAAVTSGGEIWMLDSANFNTATVDIVKSVNILAVPGAVGSFVANGGPALTIGVAGLVVSLRNVVVVPFPGNGGATGISMTGASRLNIDQSLFSGLGGFAINATAGSVKVFDSLFRSNSGAITLSNAAGEIAGTKMIDGNFGVLVNGPGPGTTTLNITDCVLSTGVEGVQASADHASAVVKVWVSRTSVRGYSYALNAYATAGIATIDVSASTIVGNQAPYSVTGAGAAIRSRGNNQFADNGSGLGPLTAVPLQ